MRIANNIMAMNTHRAYTTNNDKIAASAEKLSSGYRINKAGDDAAGLAISEKMRAQIRGLNMAKRNSQDAISLIQTAEGALQEVHSMLQRMNELANQSATGTNEAFDREQIAKEFEQLKREVNDISEQTTFNNMKILDGSLSATGVEANRSAYTSGIYTAFQKYTPDSQPGGIKVSELRPGTPYYQGATSSITVDIAGLTNNAIAQGFAIKIGDGTLTAADLAATDTNAVLIAQKFDTKEVSIGGVTYKAAATAGSSKLVLTATSKANVPIDTINKLSVSIADAKGVKGSLTNTIVVGATPGSADTNGTIASASFEYIYKDVNIGDEFKIGDKKFVFGHSIDDPAGYKKLTDDGTIVAVDKATVTTPEALKDAINTAFGTTMSEAMVKATIENGKVVITYNGTAGSTTATTNNFNTTGKTADASHADSAMPWGAAGTKYVSVVSTPYNPNEKGKTTFEIDLDKLKPGDVIKWELDDGTIQQLPVAADTTMKDIRDNLIDKKYRDQFDGNSWSIEGDKDLSSRLSVDVAKDYSLYDVMKIQIGALEGEQLSIKIAAMNTKGLELDNAEIYTQESAGKAITSTRNAINMVSDQRARLGAMQNRMTHKINNLAVSAENLQAAESRIRDVDIAQEMSKHTQANILSQAATAMLAQANAAPQNVLSLLK